MTRNVNQSHQDGYFYRLDDIGLDFPDELLKRKNGNSRNRDLCLLDHFRL